MTKLPNYIAGVAVAIIFGFSFLFTKGALGSMAVFELLFWRFFAAALSMTVLVALRVVRIDYRGKDLKGLALIALFQPVLYFVAETLGVDRTATGTAGIILAMIPVAATVLAVPFLGERPAKASIAFIVLSTVGVVAVALGKSGLAGSGGEDPLGMVFLFGAVAAAAFYNNLSRKHSLSFTAAETTYAMMVAGMLVFGGVHLCVSLPRGDALRLPPPEALPAIVYLGVFSSVGAFFLTNWNLARLEASKATVFLNLVPVVAVTAGWAVRGEKVGLVDLLGTACIVVGVWGANSARNRAKAVSPSCP